MKKDHIALQEKSAQYPYYLSVILNQKDSYL